jgi:methyl-accepting chemotaxis protein
MRPVGSVVTSALQSVKVDVRRARNLMREAMEALCGSFAVFRELLVVQQQELAAVVDALKGESQRGGFVAKMSAIVSQFVRDLSLVTTASVRLLRRVDEMTPDVDAVVQTIRKVESMAHKTRFVALNATVHSGRSGAEGRTFRIVADQVKALAEDAQGLSELVRTLVKGVHDKLSEVRKAMEELSGHDLNGAVDGQQKALVLLSSLDETNVRIRQALEEVERRAHRTIEAFEVERQVAHLLESAERQLSVLEQVWQVFVREREAPPSGCLALFEQLEPLLQSAAAVKQTSIEAGSVELF